MPGRKVRSMTIEEVKARFDQGDRCAREGVAFRTSCGAAAGELAPKHGVNKISRMLRLGRINPAGGAR